MTAITLTLTDEDAVFIRDLLDHSRQGHLNRLCDYVNTGLNERTSEYARREASAAVRCLNLRAKVEHHLRETEGTDR